MNKKSLNKMMDEQNLDLIFATSPQMRTWASAIDTSAGYTFLTKDSNVLYIDGRYIEYATKNAVNTDVRLFKTLKDLREYIAEHDYKRIGVEKEYTTLGDMKLYKSLFPNAEFVEISGPELRIIKTETELDKMRTAGDIALRALKKLEKSMKPGVTEKQLDAELEQLIRNEGGRKGSFDAIVVSGARGAMPHGDPSDKKLEEGDLLTIDFGAYYEGYASDITRTFHIGEVTNSEVLEFEKVLRTAQRMGIEAVKPGIMSGDIDKVCRDYIEYKGFGKYFVHSTGHGLGIDVHELPNVTQAPTHSRLLEPGMVITVEPGIYIEGLGGIRVEDDVLVTETGHEVLSVLK